MVGNVGVSSPVCCCACGSGRCVNVVVSSVVCWCLLGRGCWWVALLVGARIDCCHTHTDLQKVTDIGLKAFSAVLGSSPTITTVELGCKSEWLVTLL